MTRPALSTARSSFSTLATAASPTGNYTVTPSGLSSSNYAISFGTGTLTITPASLVVTADDASQVYGNALPPFTASYNGFVNGDTPGSLGGALSFSTLATAASPTGTYTVTPSGLSSSNYTISFVNGALTVTPAALTVTANAATKVYGLANPAFTASYSGLTNGDTPSSLSGTLGFSTLATAASPVGTYAVTPSGLSSSNYAISFVNGTLAVTPAPLTITANDASKVYGQRPTPRSSPRTAASSTATRRVPSGGRAQLQHPRHRGQPVGTYLLTPSGLSSSNYTISFASGALTVTPAPLTVTANAASKVYGQASTRRSTPRTAASSTAIRRALWRACSVSAPWPLRPAPSVYLPPHAVGPEFEQLHDHLRQRNPDDHPGLLDGHGGRCEQGLRPASTPPFTASYSGFLNGDTPSTLAGALSFSTLANAASSTGSYGVTPSGLSSNNYAISFASGTLAVTPAPLTVTANDASKVYGASNPPFTASYSGFVNGDTPSGSGGALSFTTLATAASPVGVYLRGHSGGTELQQLHDQLRQRNAAAITLALLDGHGDASQGLRPGPTRRLLPRTAALSTATRRAA